MHKRTVTFALITAFITLIISYHMFPALRSFIEEKAPLITSLSLLMGIVAYWLSLLREESGIPRKEVERKMKILEKKSEELVEKSHKVVEGRTDHGMLLLGLGRWGSEIVDKFRLIDKKTKEGEPKDVLEFGPFDPIKRPLVLFTLILCPSNIFFVIFYFIEDETAKFSVVFSYCIFLIILVVASILMFFLSQSDFGSILLGIQVTKKDKTIFEDIREELDSPPGVHIITEGEKATVYKFLQFQKKTLLITLILGGIISCSVAVYLNIHPVYIEVVLEFLEGILLGRGVLVEYIFTSIGIPFILSLLLRSIFLQFYLPYIKQLGLGEKKVVRILRLNVECVGISFRDYIGDLRHIDKIEIVPKNVKNLKETLRDQVLSFINRKITKEGKVYSAIMFFGIAGSDIVREFSEISPFLKQSLMEPLWFYLRFPDDHLTEEDHKAIKKLLSEMDLVFIEEEKGRIFRYYPQKQDYIRTRILERLFAIGESKWAKSILAVDFGVINQVAKRNTFSTMAYAYLEDIPREMKDNWKILVRLFTLALKERSLCDLDMEEAKSALATVRIQTDEIELDTKYDYDVVKDLLFDKFGENIHIYDIEYVSYNVEKMKLVEIDEIGVSVVNAIGQRFSAIIYEDNEGYPRPIFDYDAKRLLIDSLEYGNLLVEDVKKKELWMVLSGIEPEKILEKYH